jgi:LuxR family transcriptional regulator, maltose regulon positive regulatory protein
MREMMDTSASPLVLTKLRAPSARPRVVPRSRLVARLTPETGMGLVLVVAPAGYGKTTLLAEWTRFLLQDGVAVAWYALDASDDDPLPFGAYLVASLMVALGQTPELAHIAQRLRSSPEIDLQGLLPAVINAVVLNGRECMLILDDYHLISAPAIHSTLAYLLEHRPENLHIVIGSRADPPLPLARLRAQGQLREIRAADLRFTTEETALFLNEVMRLALSPELIAALAARTEGWVAGLQLAALSLSDRSDKERFISSFTGSQRYLVEYLLEEVVSRQPEEVQSFLLSTSVVERLCGPLCDALLGEFSGAEAILERLQRTNLFVVALDDQGYWYRYHHLFRDFLRTRLQKTQPERVASLHRAASEWHTAHGFLREAVQHAFQTTDWTYAAAVVEQHSFPLMMRGEVSTIYEWCAAFPEEVMRLHPGLSILHSWALVLGFRRQNRGRVEERLQQAEQAAARLEDRALGRALIGQAAVVRTFLAMTPDPAADPRKQLALAQGTLDQLPEGDLVGFGATLTVAYAHMALHDADAASKALEVARRLALSGRLYYGVAVASADQARLAHAQGQLQRAADICLQGQADIAALLARDEPAGPALGCLAIALGAVYLEWDRLADAEETLLHGLDMIGRGMNPFYEMMALVTLSHLREVQSRSAEALAFLARLEETWPDIALCARGLRITHALRLTPEDRDTLVEAANWCQAFSSSLGDHMPPPGMGPLGAAEAYYLAYLAWVRSQIAIGKAQITWPYLEQQLHLAQANGLTNRVIELSLLEAQAGKAADDKVHTWAAVERALLAGERAGYLRIFDQGAALSRLLVEAADRGICRDYVKRILAAIAIPRALEMGNEGDAAAPSTPARPAQAAYLDSYEHLSERELEVLRLMAQGASNQEIAERLVITVGTVKSHINHILGKLAAHNRTEAVARARGLDLLDI